MPLTLAIPRDVTVQYAAPGLYSTKPPPPMKVWEEYPPFMWLLSAHVGDLSSDIVRDVLKFTLWLSVSVIMGMVLMKFQERQTGQTTDSARLRSPKHPLQPPSQKEQQPQPQQQPQGQQRRQPQQRERQGVSQQQQPRKQQQTRLEQDEKTIPSDTQPQRQTFQSLPTAAAIPATGSGMPVLLSPATFQLQDAPPQPELLQKASALLSESATLRPSQAYPLEEVKQFQVQIAQMQYMLATQQLDSTMMQQFRLGVEYAAAKMLQMRRASGQEHSYQQ